MASVTSILEAFGATILVNEFIGDYQGSNIFVLSETRGWGGGQRWYGFLIEGYGSCSGCDSWMAVEDDLVETAKLALESARAVRWFDSLEELKEWCGQVDPANEWWANESEWSTINEKIQALEASDG